MPEAVLIIDVLAVRIDGERPELIVGEVKTYPDRGGHTDSHELALARAQAGIYVHALDVVCEKIDVADSAQHLIRLEPKRIRLSSLVQCTQIGIAREP